MKPIAHLLLATSLILSSGPSTGSAANNIFPSDNPPGKFLPGSLDRSFVEDAGQGLIFEVVSANLALTHSTNPPVRKFARQMINAHSRDYARLTQLANNLAIPVPMGPDDKQLAQLKVLSALFGPAFDRAYLRSAIQIHLEEIKLYTNQAKNGTNPTLNRFANSRIGELYQHIQLAFAAASQGGVNLSVP